MLNAHNVAATIAVRDLKKSRSFYEGILGLEPVQSDGINYMAYKSGSVELLVYQSEFAGGYKATVATWGVGDDIEAIVETLAGKGVAFEHYTHLPGTVLHGDIHVIGDMKNAWFKDPDGNIICLVNA